MADNSNMEVTRLFDILQHFSENHKGAVALCGKENGIWTPYTIENYIEKVNAISSGLLQLGVKKGDRIASISNNRPEWNFLDMAILQIGAVHVSIYPTISENDYKFILENAGVKLVFVSGWDLLRKITNVLAEYPELNDNVYTFRNLRGYKHLNQIIELGEANLDTKLLDEIKASVQPDDTATLIYTSGTTGVPKGAMLSHSNILYNMKAILPIVPMRDDTKVLSYLPLCHVYERMMIYAWQYLGIPVYYAESLGTIAADLKDIHPTIFTTVPRLLEKFYDRIIVAGRKLKKPAKRMFFWADKVASEYKIDNQSFIYRAELAVARKMVLRKWKAELGGNLDVIVSGGAPIQPQISRIFWAAEMPVLNGYGLTETSPVIAVNNFFKNGAKFGTCGPILPGIEVKISDDGEILTRGHCLMKGYYNAPELTAEVIDADGWFHTGDIGNIDADGCLTITGRKKEMFKTAFGKYVVPALIETRFMSESIIDNIMVVGENRKFAAALIVPNFIDLRGWCAKKGIPYTTNEEMVNNNDVIAKFKRVVNKYNASLGETEKIKKFHLVPYEWSVQTGELTPTLKLKRKFISEKFNREIEKLFD